VNVQLETVLIALGAIVILGVLAKFGRAIGRFVLALAGIVAVVVVALAILTQGAANFQTAKAAQDAAQAAQDAAQAVKVSSVGQTLAIGAIAALVVGGLVVALIGTLGVAGYCALRWRLAERQRLQRPDLSGWLPGPGALWGRRQPRRLTERATSGCLPPVVYIVQDDLPQAVGGWGFDEVEEWTNDGWPACAGRQL
jgi:hypothetical protein